MKKNGRIKDIMMSFLLLISDIAMVIKTISEMRRASWCLRKCRKDPKFWYKTLKERDSSRDLGVDKRIVQLFIVK
jgi:hypothetical protein